MKYKLAITMAAIILLAAICEGCIDPTLPVFEMTETEEDGICVVIDGVKYKQLPKIKWDVNQYDEIIGYAGNRDLSVSTIKGDTDRNFIFLQGFWDEMYVLHREGIPAPSADIVDKFIWDEYLMGGAQEYTYVKEDMSIIKELFEVLETGNNISEYHSIKKGSESIIMYIACYSSKIPGAQYRLDIDMSNGKIICGDREEDEFVEIPLNLLEKIAGKQIDSNEFKED